MKDTLPKPILTTEALRQAVNTELRAKRIVKRDVTELQRSIIARVIDRSENPVSVARDYKISVDLLLACIVAHYHDEMEARAEAADRLIQEAWA